MKTRSARRAKTIAMACVVSTALNSGCMTRALWKGHGAEAGRLAIEGRPSRLSTTQRGDVSVTTMRIDWLEPFARYQPEGDSRLRDFLGSESTRYELTLPWIVPEEDGAAAPSRRIVIEVHGIESHPNAIRPIRVLFREVDPHEVDQAPIEWHRCELLPSNALPAPGSVDPMAKLRDPEIESITLYWEYERAEGPTAWETTWRVLVTPLAVLGDSSVALAGVAVIVGIVLLAKEVEDS